MPHFVFEINILAIMFTENVRSMANINYFIVLKPVTVTTIT